MAETAQIEAQSLMKVQPLMESQSLTESQSQMETQSQIETQHLMEAQSQMEVQPQTEAQPLMEAQPLTESQPLMEVQPLIEVEGLNLWYAEKQALKNISMQIPKNSVTALIGPSGCGKSTFIRCLNRMNDLIKSCKIEGKVLLNGKNIYEPDVDVVDLRKQVGMVFQKPNPFPMSIYDNIAYGPRIQGVKKKDLEGIVETALRSAALWNETSDRLKSPALSLSGGQQQRLCIARTMAVKPEIILFDEPCSALDPISTSRIEELIMNLKKDYTIVIVTHNMQQAARISDYTGFFLMGELIEFGRTRQIFENPMEKSTEEYITGRFG